MNLELEMDCKQFTCNLYDNLYLYFYDEHGNKVRIFLEQKDAEKFIAELKKF